MKDDMGDPYGLYEESYWDSVRARDKEKPKNAGSKNQSEGRGDQDSTEKPEREVHKRRGRPKKGAKGRANNRRTSTQNETALDKILS